MEILQPADYLNSWSRHSDLRDEILSMNQTILTNVMPDMKIEGQIKITAD
jgi:hypothetical protein